MKIEEFTKLINNAKENNNHLYSRSDKYVVNNDEIEKYENLLNIKFNNQYIYFLKEFGGGNFFYTNIFSLNDEDKYYNLIINNKKYNKDIINKIFISDNECGDFYGFKILNGTCSEEIYFFNHEENYKAEKVSNDLFEFIEEYGLNT